MQEPIKQMIFYCTKKKKDNDNKINEEINKNKENNTLNNNN